MIKTILTFCDQGTTTWLLLTAMGMVYYGLKQLAPKQKGNKQKSPLLRRQLTPIGKFALLSQTERNPSVITFFIALASKDEGMRANEFEDLWTTVMDKHPRFRFNVSAIDKCFEENTRPLAEHILEVSHPANPDHFKERVNSFLTTPLDVSEQPWEVCLSSGPIGSSGAILNSKELSEQGYVTETVALFRVHHVVCDGVSISTVVKDVADEATKLDDMMLHEVEKFTALAQKVGSIQRLVCLFMYYAIGSIYAISLQLWNMIFSSNPFEVFTKNLPDTENKSSVDWAYLADIEDAKNVAKSVSRHTKLNDLFVALLGAALERQYQDLKEKSNASREICFKPPSSVNIVVPVSLRRYPWEEIGNNIGAFVTTIPFNPEERQGKSLSRLRQISKTLSRIKQTPAPLISWFTTSLISWLGSEAVAKDVIVRANCHATAVVSNVHGFPFQIHWKGRPVGMLCPFLPLPPGVPVGICCTSYDGKLILSVEADANIVPDPKQFLDYMLEEYEAIKLIQQNEASKSET